MSHMVIHEVDGIDHHERFAAIDEAISHVERLRNEGNQSARLFRLEELQFEVKAYYRVQVGSAPAPMPALPDAEIEIAAPPADPSPEPMTVEAVADIVSDDTFATAATEIQRGNREDLAVSTSLGGARRGLFGR